MSQVVNLGPYRIRPRGPYSQEENYRFLDLVEFNGGSYMCINYDTIDGVSCKGISPISEQARLYWQCIAEKGEPGLIEVEYLPIINLEGDTWDFNVSDKVYVPQDFSKVLKIEGVREGDCGALITKNKNLQLPTNSDYSLDFNYVNITSANEYYLYTFMYINLGGTSPRFIWNRTVYVKQ